MSSWISRATESRNAQLITTAVVSGALAASTILGFQQARRMYRVAEVKASIPDIDDDHQASRVGHMNPQTKLKLTFTEDDRVWRSIQCLCAK
jgi:hypothetical protein